MRQHLNDRRTTLWIAGGGDDPRGLVEQDVDRVAPRRERAVVDADLISR
jgi:hypothetical protein